MDRYYKGLIWTNHALSRLSERGIKQGDAWATFVRPDTSRKAQTKGAYIYYKTYGKSRIEVVAKKNEEGKWVILSVWSKDIFESNYKKRKDSFFVFFLKKILHIT